MFFQDNEKRPNNFFSYDFRTKAILWALSTRMMKKDWFSMVRISIQLTTLKNFSNVKRFKPTIQQFFCRIINAAIICVLMFPFWRAAISYTKSVSFQATFFIFEHVTLNEFYEIEIYLFLSYYSRSNFSNTPHCIKNFLLSSP